MQWCHAHAPIVLVKFENHVLTLLRDGSREDLLHRLNVTGPDLVVQVPKESAIDNGTGCLEGWPTAVEAQRQDPLASSLAAPDTT